MLLFQFPLTSPQNKNGMPLFFFNSYLAVPWPTLGHFRGDSLLNPMLITAFLLIRPEGHWEPCNEVGSLSPAEHLVGFEPGTSDSNFNALTH